jgi:hypothetical protein
MLSVICMWPMQKTCKLQETLPRICSFLTHALTNGCTNLTIYVHNFKLANLLSILANKGLAHYLCLFCVNNCYPIWREKETKLSWSCNQWYHQKCKSIQMIPFTCETSLEQNACWNYFLRNDGSISFQSIILYWHVLFRSFLLTNESDFFYFVHISIES